VPFGLHQLLEYLLAGALAEFSVHIARSGLLLGAACAFALLALTARGPLGVARVCGARLHGALDVAVALAAAAAPAVPVLRPDAAGVVVVEVAAVAWLRLATLTRYRRPAGADNTVAPGSAPPPDPAGPPPAGARGAGTPAQPAGGAVGTPVARTLGVLAGRSSRRLPGARAMLAGGAREAGRRAGRLQRTWRTPRSGGA